MMDEKKEIPAPEPIAQAPIPKEVEAEVLVLTPDMEVKLP